MNYLLLRTSLGRSYARRIAEHLRDLRGNRAFIYKATSIDLAFQKHPEWNKDNLIIHARAANPGSYWMKKLEELEKNGYRVINKTSILKLTSDKFTCNKTLEEMGFNVPRTFLLKRNEELSREVLDQIRTDYIIIKPRYSQGGGKFVEKIHRDFLDKETVEKARMSYDCSSIVQEFLNYEEIYRTFIINRNALPILTMDTPSDDEWKVSVCLNPWQIPYCARDINRSELFKTVLNYGESVQRYLGGEINFVDVYNVGGQMFVSEINTACSLNTHERLLHYPISLEIARYLNSLK